MGDKQVPEEIKTAVNTILLSGDIKLNDTKTAENIVAQNQKLWNMASDCKALKMKAIERRITKHGLQIKDMEDIFMSASEFIMFKEAVNSIINGQNFTTNMIEETAM